MKTYLLSATFLCDQANDGASGNAGGSGHSESTSTPGGTGVSQADQGSVKNIWGGREAPAWTKEIGLEAKHEETEQKAGVPVLTKPVPPVKGPTKAEPAPITPDLQQPVTPVVPVTQAAANAGFDEEKLAKALATALRPAQDNSPRPLSPEQIRQQLAIYEVSADDYEAILGVKPDSPARLAAFNKVLQAVAKQATTIATVLNQNALGDMQRRMDPFVTTTRAQEAERQKGLFFKEHADLTGYDALIEREFNALLQSGYRVTADNLQSARKTVADRTRETLKALGITPTPTGRQAQQSVSDGQPPRQNRQMAPTSGGGRGAGSAQSNTQSTNKIEAVWGKR